MSIVCAQCNGKGGTRGQEAIIDISVNTEIFQGDKPAAGLCSQCNGTGVQNI